MLVISELGRGQELLEVLASQGTTSSARWSHRQALLALLYFTYSVTGSNYEYAHMLPVTGALTRVRATVTREMQIWYAGALNGVTWCFGLMRRGAAGLQTPCRLSPFHVWIFVLEGGVFQWPSAVSLAAPWLQGGPEERQDGGSSLGWVGKGVLSSHSSCGKTLWFRYQDSEPHDLMGQRKWLMRSDSPLGDVSLPGS